MYVISVGVGLAATEIVVTVAMVVAIDDHNCGQ